MAVEGKERHESYNRAIQEIARYGRANCDRLFQYYLPGGKWKYGIYIGALNPTRNDKHPGSFKGFRDGRWFDFATQQRGDVLDLERILYGGDAVEAARRLNAKLGNPVDMPGNPVGIDVVLHRPKTADTITELPEIRKWEAIFPVPEEAGEQPFKQLKAKNARGAEVYHEISRLWTYRDEEGRVLCHIARIDTAHGKEFRPITWCVNTKTGETKWFIGGLPSPRPLYGLQLLTAHPEALVLMVEGEKCADAANALFAEHGYPMIAISWMNGADGIRHADTQPLNGRDCILWPDNDEPGLKAMDELSKRVPNSIIMPIPGEHTQGWDIADAIAEGATYEQVLEWTEAVQHVQALTIPASDDGEVANPGYEYITPFGWEIDLETGVWRFQRHTSRGEDRWEKILVCPNPVVLTQVLENIEDGTEKLEVCFLKEGKWKRVIYPRSVIMNRPTIIRLVDQGLQFTSEKSADMVRYFDAFDIANRVPVTKSIQRFGWIGKEFFPYCKGIVFENDPKFGLDMWSAVQPSGSLSDWVNVAAEAVRISPDARILMAASLASPLVKVLGKRSFILEAWGATRHGKSAAAKLAISVWGKPEVLMGTFNSTLVNLERKAAALHNLPYLIDERQLHKEKYYTLTDMIYMLTEDQGRGRGDRDGGMQAVSTWRNIVITTGETPMMHNSSDQGERSRTMELKVEMFDDEEYPGFLHRFVRENYALAGQQYIEGILTRDIKEDYSVIYQLLKEQGRHYHLENIATLCLGDFYGSMFIWGKEESEALESAFRMGCDLLSRMTAEVEIDRIDLAWEFVKGWIVSNSLAFRPDFVRERYGKINANGQYCIIQEHLRKALDTAGYNPGQSIHAFGDRGYLEVERDNAGKIRRTKRVRYDNDRVDSYVIAHGMMTAGNDDDDDDKESEIDDTISW